MNRLFVGTFLLVATTLAGCATLPTKAPSPLDHRITAEVYHRLSQDPLTSQAMLSVSTRGASVVLRGQPAGHHVRTRALALARGTPGVVEVIDRMEQ